MVILYCKLWTAANHHSFVYNILTISTSLTPRYTIIASLLCLGHTCEHRDTFTLFYTPPPAARGCWKVWNSIPLLSLFELLFAPKRRTKTNFIWSISGPLTCVLLNYLNNFIVRSLAVKNIWESLHYKNKYFCPYFNGYWRSLNMTTLCFTAIPHWCLVTCIILCFVHGLIID